VVRESEGASLLPLLGFLILYKIGCNHRRYHQSPSKQAMGMWKLGTKSHHLLSPTPRCSSRLGEAGGAGEGLISSPSWPVAPLLSFLAMWLGLCSLSGILAGSRLCAPSVWVIAFLETSISSIASPFAVFLFVY